MFGAEADLQASGADDVFAAWKFSNPWFGTLRGRAGVAINNVMLYGTLGLAYGTLRAQSVVSGVTGIRKPASAWPAGVGLEVAFFGNWTARAEYLYVDLGERSVCDYRRQSWHQFELLRFGVNYRF